MLAGEVVSTGLFLGGRAQGSASLSGALATGRAQTRRASILRALAFALPRALRFGTGDEVGRLRAGVVKHAVRSGPHLRRVLVVEDRIDIATGGLEMSPVVVLRFALDRF